MGERNKTFEYENTFGGFSKDELIEFLKEEALKTKDPINWLYALEEALYKVTENFDWIEE